MPRLHLCALLVLNCCAVLRAADDNPSVLKFDSGGSITAPEGYVWKKTGEQEIEGKKIPRFVAVKQDSPNTIFLAIEPETVDMDAKRLRRVKGFYNGLLKSLEKIGATDIQAPIPDVQSPVPDRVQFLFSMKMKAKPFAVCAVLFFGKNTYHMQFAGGSDDEALTLAKSAQSLKE